MGRSASRRFGHQDARAAILGDQGDGDPSSATRLIRDRPRTTGVDEVCAFGIGRVTLEAERLVHDLGGVGASLSLLAASSSFDHLAIAALTSIRSAHSFSKSTGMTRLPPVVEISVLLRNTETRFQAGSTQRARQDSNL